MPSSQAHNALAVLMAEIRPDWQTPGIVAALRKVDPNIPVAALTVGAVRYASDLSNLTPAHLSDFGNRAWDTDWHVPCRRHPEQSRRTTAGECASCRSERLEGHDRPERKPSPPPAPLRQLYAAHRTQP